MKNYYQALGISLEATESEIKTAYKKLALKFHPDVNNNDTFFEEQFKKVNEAYQTLSVKQKKEEYDIELALFTELENMVNNPYFSHPSESETEEKEYIDPEEAKKCDEIISLFDHVLELIKNCKRDKT